MSRSPRIALVDSHRIADGSVDFHIHHSSGSDPDLDHMLIVNIRHADESCPAFNNRQNCKHITNVAEGGFDGKWRLHDFQRVANPRQADMDEALMLTVLDMMGVTVTKVTAINVANSKRHTSLKPTTWAKRFRKMKSQGWINTTKTHITITEEGKEALVRPPDYIAEEMSEATESHETHAGG